MKLLKIAAAILLAAPAASRCMDVLPIEQTFERLTTPADHFQITAYTLDQNGAKVQEAGYLNFQAVTPCKAKILTLYVHPAYRNRKVAKRLFCNCIRLLYVSGFQKISWQAMPIDDEEQQQLRPFVTRARELQARYIHYCHQIPYNHVVISKKMSFAGVPMKLILE